MWERWFEGVVCPHACRHTFRSSATDGSSCSSHVLTCTAIAAPSLITPRCHLCWDPTRSSTQSLFIFLIRDLWHALWPLCVSLGLFSVDPDQFFITYHPSGSPACLIQSSLGLPSRAALWEKIKMDWTACCVAVFSFPWFTKLLPGIIYCSYNKSWGWTKRNWASTYSIAVVI